MLPQKPDPLLLAQILRHVTALGCIHPAKELVSPPLCGEGIANSVAYFTLGLEGYAKLVNPDLIDQLKPWQGYGDFEEYYVPETAP